METTNQNQLSILDNINKPLEEKEIVNEKPEEQKCKEEEWVSEGEPITRKLKSKCENIIKPYLLPVDFRKQSYYCDYYDSLVKAEWHIDDYCEEHLKEKKLTVEEIQNGLRYVLKRRIEERIPEKFRNADLNKSLKVVQDYYLQKKYKEKGFFLYGEFGTGKSYNVYALAKYLLANDVDVWIFNLPRLLNVIRASFTKQEAYNEDSGNTSYAFVKDMGGIEELIKKEVLIIDDIGAEKPSDWVAETLYYLINTRYENMKITIFTSNLSLDALADKVGDRIVSRITEMCDTYELKGNDRRLENPDWNAKKTT